MSPERDVVELLRAVLVADDVDLPDNETLATAMGWDLERVAAALDTARTRLLVWGQRSPRKPSPWFTELEITVQGRRLLRADDAQ